MTEHQEGLSSALEVMQTAWELRDRSVFEKSVEVVRDIFGSAAKNATAPAFIADGLLDRALAGFDVLEESGGAMDGGMNLALITNVYDAQIAAARAGHAALQGLGLMPDPDAAVQ